jgi:hypothetical protein
MTACYIPLRRVLHIVCIHPGIHQDDGRCKPHHYPAQPDKQPQPQIHATYSIEKLDIFVVLVGEPLPERKNRHTKHDGFWSIGEVRALPQ